MIEPYYKDDWVTIYHGDCLEIMLDLEQCDLILTDPPYNLGKKYGAKFNDARDPDQYWEWFLNVFEKAFKLISNGYFYISHSDKGVYRAKSILETIGFEYIQTLIWWGPNGYSMQLKRKTWSYRHEPILFMGKGELPDLEAGEKGMWYTSVLPVPRPQSNFKEGRYHLTQKPLKLYKIILQRTPSDCILDPFLGSGTTCVAAKQLNRKCIGIEIEEKYCEIAAKRCSQEVLDLR